MNIPQAELDKLKDASFTDESEETPEEEVEELEKIKPEVQEQVSASTDEDAVADKARVPYSRFESVHERAIRAEERAKLLEEQLAGNRTMVSNEEVDLPQEWVELYGDSDAAKRAYQLQLGQIENLQEQAVNKVLERIQSQNKEEHETLSKNLEYIEDNLAKFQESLGRNLTEAEESGVLDVQDEFTPKDEDGRYIGNLLSPDKAFEIYTLRQQTANATKVRAKNRVVALTGANSEGETSASSAADYNPNAWGAWRGKV